MARALIRLACSLLPEHERDDRFREWTAELQAILNDGRPLPRIRGLLYAADQNRGAWRRPGPALRAVWGLRTPSGYRLAPALLMLAFPACVWAVDKASFLDTAIVYVIFWTIGFFRPGRRRSGS
jgi:hypothetical protein